MKRELLWPAPYSNFMSILMRWICPECNKTHIGLELIACYRHDPPRMMRGNNQIPKALLELAHTPTIMLNIHRNRLLGLAGSDEPRFRVQKGIEKYSEE